MFNWTKYLFYNEHPYNWTKNGLEMKKIVYVSYDSDGRKKIINVSCNGLEIYVGF